MYTQKTAKPAKLKKPPFPDEQIRIKAYQISQKYPERSREENWYAAIKLLKKEQLFRPLISVWRWTGIGEKKGWDLLQLLIVPLILTLGGFWLNESAKQREQEAATDKAQQETLVKYLDQMFAAIKTDDLLNAKSDKKTFIIAQIRTITALQSLYPDRQRAIFQFLRTADLLNRKNLDHNKSAKSKPKNSSQYQHYHGLFYNARMPRINLRKADLSFADLSGAHLTGANLSGARLSFTDLSGARLRDVNLDGANLSDADLYNADLTGAKE